MRAFAAQQTAVDDHPRCAVIKNARAVGTAAPDSAASAPAAAHFLIAKRSASAGTVANARNSQNTVPAMIAMCRPEIDST